MQWIVVASLLLGFAVVGEGQSKPPGAVAQGPRVYDLSDLFVTPGEKTAEKTVRFTVTAKPDAPTDNVYLFYLVRESGGTPFALLRLDAADVSECVSRETPGQVAGWPALEVCRIKKPPVLIGWRGRAKVPAAQLAAGKIELRLAGLPPEGWLEIGLSRGALDPTKDPVDRILSNALLVKLDAAAP